MPINKTHVLPVQTLRTSKVYIYCPGIVLGRAAQRQQLRQRRRGGAAVELRYCCRPTRHVCRRSYFNLAGSRVRAASRLYHLRNSTASETSAASPLAALHTAVCGRALAHTRSFSRLPHTRGPFLQPSVEVYLYANTKRNSPRARDSNGRKAMRSKTIRRGAKQR